MNAIAVRPDAAPRRNPVVRALAGLPRGATLSILVYHRVLERRDPLRPGEPTRDAFESRMHWLKSNFDLVTLAEGIAGLRGRSLPARALAVTFDDGYRDNHDVALPVLARLGVPATFFVATGYLDGGRMFNDTVIEAIRIIDAPEIDLEREGLGVHPLGGNAERSMAAQRILGGIKYLSTAKRDAIAARIASLARGPLPDDLMMSSGQVAGLRAAGMDVGAHTVAHPILARLEPARARREIEDGRVRLEAITGARVSLFAYPNGRPHTDYTTAHVAMVRDAGFTGAVSTAFGAARAGMDVLQLPRFTPWDRSHWKFGLRLARTRLRAGANVVDSPGGALCAPGDAGSAYG